MAAIAFLSTAHIHTRTFIEQILCAGEGHRVAGIWDDVPERGRRYAQSAGAPFVERLEDLLADPAVDGFLICAENTHHLPLLQKALPLGKPVFCEKPLVTSPEDLATLRGLLAPQSPPLFCGYFLPFSGEMLAIARLLREGALGQITRVEFVNAHHGAYARWFDHPDLAWFCEPALSAGGAFMDMGTHAVHLLRTLFGPVREVFAEIGNHSGIYPTTDDYGVALLRFGSGILGEVKAAWTQTGGVGGLSVTGSEASIWNTPQGYVIGKPGAEPAKIAPAAPQPDRVERLLKAIRGEICREELTADLDATMDTVAIIDAAYRSASLGSWVPVAAR